MFWRPFADVVDTLNAKIDDLNAELRQLRGTSAPAASTPKPPTVATPTKPVTPTAPTTKPVATPTAMETEIARAHAARTAGLSSKPLAEQSIGELRAALNAEQDSEKRAAIYRQLKQVERDSKLSNPTAKLRGV